MATPDLSLQFDPSEILLLHDLIEVLHDLPPHVEPPEELLFLLARYARRQRRAGEVHGEDLGWYREIYGKYYGSMMKWGNWFLWEVSDAIYLSFACGEFVREGVMLQSR
jgi:hypothetical protein